MEYEGRGRVGSGWVGSGRDEAGGRRDGNKLEGGGAGLSPKGTDGGV